MKWIIGLLLSSTFLSTASAQKVVTESVPGTRNVIHITTGTPRVHFSTRSYGGGVSNVGVATSSNVVVSDPTSSDKVVIYATGTIVAQHFSGPSLSSTTTIGLNQTFIPGDGFDVFQVCHSTLSITTNGGKVAIWFSGGLGSSTNGASLGLNVLEDGEFISPYTKDIGIVQLFATSADNDVTQNASFHIVIRAPSAGSHNYCIAPRVSAGTGKYSITSAQASFGVMEVR